jgi:hypothetical protein
MKKTRGEITRTILLGILLAGGIAVAATSPYFVSRVLPKLVKYASYKWKRRKNEKKRFYNIFYELKKKGLIKMQNRSGQVYISLTEEGRKRAGKYQINDLKIKKPRKWDRKWRILIFDISNKHRLKREALRGKIKELGLYPLQKSVWVYPYNFCKEADILKNFLGLNDKEMKVITAFEVEHDEEIKIHFGLSRKK